MFCCTQRLIIVREKTTAADAFSRTPLNIAARNAARVALRLERRLDIVSVKKTRAANYELNSSLTTINSYFCKGREFISSGRERTEHKLDFKLQRNTSSLESSIADPFQKGMLVTIYIRAEPFARGQSWHTQSLD